MLSTEVLGQMGQLHLTDLPMAGHSLKVGIEALLHHVYSQIHGYSELQGSIDSCVFLTQLSGLCVKGIFDLILKGLNCNL